MFMFYTHTYMYTFKYAYIFIDTNIYVHIHKKNCGTKKNNEQKFHYYNLTWNKNIE